MKENEKKKNSGQGFLQKMYKNWRDFLYWTCGFGSPSDLDLAENNLFDFFIRPGILEVSLTYIR